jgi:alkylation response protein AidB-like acyl-CoA dehydrogenase
MDFSLTDDQAMLAHSVGRFVDTEYDFESRQKFAASDGGFSREMWATFAELGVTTVPFAEEDGGLGGGPVELMLIMEQLGRGLVVEPYLANIVLAGGALRRAASTGQRERWLTPIIAGESHAALAFAEPQARYDIRNVATHAKAEGDGYVLSGSKTMVLNGGAANMIIVPARTSGNTADEDGITLLGVPADARGVEIRPYPTVDALQAADIDFNDVTVDENAVLGDVGKGFATLQAVIDEATLAISAEAVGIMQAMHDKTVEYSRNRTQFGVPIGTFQALQHRMVDTMIACEQSRSLLYWSVMLSTTESPEAQNSISALKYQVGTAGITVAREAVQLHGGMGVTWELDIAHYFKRMTAIDATFGNADFHLDRYIGTASAS